MGSATLAPLSLATDGTAITGIGGDPGNDNTATFTVSADRAGLYALRIRYSNPEQSEATHYNPDPLARHADITVNGGEIRRVGFPHSFHQNNFWELTVPVQLRKGQNTIAFRSEEVPNFDGATYVSDTFPGVLLRSRNAPLRDRPPSRPTRGRCDEVNTTGGDPRRRCHKQVPGSVTLRRSKRNRLVRPGNTA